MLDEQKRRSGQLGVDVTVLVKVPVCNGSSGASLTSPCPSSCIQQSARIRERDPRPYVPAGNIALRISSILLMILSNC